MMTVLCSPSRYRSRRNNRRVTVLFLLAIMALLRGLLRKRERSLAAIILPGVGPQEYKPAEEMEMYIDWVKSKKTQVHLFYYHLPTCDGPPFRGLTLAQKQRRLWSYLESSLQGHRRLWRSPFSISAKLDLPCTPLCVVKLQGEKLRWLRKLVEQQYRVQLTLDQLPALMRSKELNYAVRGYPIGFNKAPPGSDLLDNEVYLYNHLKFTISYKENQDESTLRIIGFDVHPVSIKHDIPKDLEADDEDRVKTLEKTNKLSTCNDNVVNDPSTYLNLRSDTGSMHIAYSYEVEWQETTLEWADRWDVYLLGTPDDGIHYFSIVNSLMIVVFLTGVIATVMIRTLRKDTARYKEMHILEESQEETRWKLLHGDVFRPPQFSPMLFSVLVGTGAQIGAAFLCAIILGLLNPMNTGQTLTAIIFLYVLSGSIAGYISARLYKFCQATAWKQTAFLTATLFPSFFLAMFSFLNNYFLSEVDAEMAVSFLNMSALFFLWTCVSVPLVVLGSFFGHRANKIEVPTMANQIARAVPDLPWHLNPIVTMLMGGILPFGSVALFMRAWWLQQFYYVMRFHLAALFILGATCAEVSIIMCYLQLCAEDHHWWWRSFWNCASSGFYLFLYSLWFMLSRLDIGGGVSLVIYFTYMSMMSVCFGVFCGSIGVLSNFWFTRTIYGKAGPSSTNSMIVSRVRL